MPSVRALILDYGEVLTRPQRVECILAMAARVDASVDVFQRAYWDHRRAYDAGLPAVAYWQRVLATLRPMPSPSAPASTIEWLIASDITSWTDYREDVWAVARQFRAGGGRTGFLSNGVPEIMARVRADRALDAAFDAVVVSSEVGVTKPHPRIFEICLARLGVAPHQALFVDDRTDNIEAAARLGLRTLHFAGPDAVPRLRGLV